MRANYRLNPINPKYVFVILGIAIILSLLTAKAFADSEILQPNGVGKDTWLQFGYQSRNYGISATMDIKPGNDRNALIEFDISTIPSNAVITSATLKLYVTSSGTGPDQVINVHKVTSSWVEGTGNGIITGDGATWNTYDGVNSWATKGGDYDENVSASTTKTAGVADIWVTWDVTGLVTSWHNGTYPNYGVLIKTTTANSGITTFATSDNSNASRRPILEINYCVENWTMQQGGCLINDSALRYYVDENACGTTSNLPGDNGTYVACDYCSEDITGPYDANCNISDQQIAYYVDNNYASCCAVTGLSSDCHINNGSYNNQTFSCNYCTPTWENVNSSCNPDDTFDVGYYYTNNCCTQTGLLSDCNIPSNTTDSCDYCAPNWGTINTTCQSNDQLVQYYSDSNNCYAQTGLPNDNNPPANQTFSCDYCQPNWYEINTSCQADNTIIGWWNDSNNCYAKTSLPSDNNPPANNTYACDYYSAPGEYRGGDGRGSSVGSGIVSAKQPAINISNQSSLANTKKPVSEASNASIPSSPITGTAVQIEPFRTANPLFAVPSLLLLILLFAILALNREKLSERVKKMLVRLHIALLMTIVSLLIFTFVSNSSSFLSSLTGGVININILQTQIQVSNLVLGLAMFLAGLTVVILAWVFHHKNHNGKKFKL